MIDIFFLTFYIYFQKYKIKPRKLKNEITNKHKY